VIALFTATFVGFGGLLVLLGTTQEALAESLGLGLADTGQLAAALSLGLAVGVAGAGPLVDRAARRPLFVAANLLAGATLSLADAGWGRPGIAIAVATVGLAAGALETLMNAAIADRYAERAARPLAGVHVGVNLGAVAAPPLLGALAAASGWPGAFRALGALFLLVAALGTLVPLPRPRGHAARVAGGRLPLGALLPLGLVAACYVGLETALTVFAVPYARDGLGLEPGAGIAAISGLWLGIGGGRVLLALWRSPVDARHLAAAGFTGALVLAGMVALRVEPLPLAMAAFGLCIGGVFPLLMALAAQRAPTAAGTAAGLVAGCGAAGGLAVPWLTGALGDAAGPTTAVASLAAWCLAVGGLALLARRGRDQP
jgi:MFS family permease